jgi:hypothetical protein
MLEMRMGGHVSLFRVVRDGACILMMTAVILISATSAEAGATNRDKEAQATKMCPVWS